MRCTASWCGGAPLRQQCRPGEPALSSRAYRWPGRLSQDSVDAAGANEAKLRQPGTKTGQKIGTVSGWASNGAARGEGQRGCAPGGEPRHRRNQFPHRQMAGLADPGRRHRIGRQRHHPKAVRHVVERLARAAMGDVRHRVPAVLAMDVALQRTHPHRHREQCTAAARAEHDRRDRPRLLPAAALHHHDHHVLAVLHEVGPDQRAIDECRRAAAMARQDADPDRLHRCCSSRASPN